ncbi:MAG: hypothetical protein ACE5E1_02595 [Phycisphaerae bacterium]
MDSRARHQDDQHGGQGFDIVFPPEAETTGERTPCRRPWVGVHFECCGVYSRIYRRPEARQYEGRCPQCGLPIRIRVGPNGIRAKVLRARPR